MITKEDRRDLYEDDMVIVTRRADGEEFFMTLDDFNSEFCLHSYELADNIMDGENEIYDVNIA